MRTIPFDLPSADGRSRLKAVIWEPESAPRGIIQVAHGVTEHMGRYTDFARYFTVRGYAVLGHDHLGHGLTAQENSGAPMYFGPDGSWQHVTADVQTCAEEARRRYPGLPLCLLGFSLGSFAVRCAVAETPTLADMTVWAGTGQMSAPELAMASLVIHREEKLHGDQIETPLLHQLTMEAYNRRFRPCRTEADWLFADPAAAEEYLGDPLVGRGFTVGSFRELLRGMKLCHTEAYAGKMRRDMPILLLSGSDDPVGDRGRALKALERQLSKLHFTDVEALLFPGLRHDVLHDAGCEKVFAALAAWLEKHMARG